MLSLIWNTFYVAGAAGYMGRIWGFMKIIVSGDLFLWRYTATAAAATAAAATAAAAMCCVVVFFFY